MYFTWRRKPNQHPKHRAFNNTQTTTDKNEENNFIPSPFKTFNDGFLLKRPIISHSSLNKFSSWYSFVKLRRVTNRTLSIYLGWSKLAQSVQCLTTDWTAGVRSPTEAEDFSSNLCIQTGSGAHPASCTVGTGGSFPGGKTRPGRDTDHSPPSSVEVKKE
jgi:hypothetical protein